MRRLTLSQLHRFVQHPCADSLRASALFLGKELPLRLHLEEHRVRNQTSGEFLQQEGTQRYGRALQDARATIESVASRNVTEFTVGEYFLAMKNFETEVKTFVSFVGSSKSCRKHRVEVSQVLEGIFLFLIGARVAISQHFRAASKMEMAGQDPQKQTPNKGIGPEIRKVDLSRVLQATISDLKAFTIEKFGVCPEVKMNLLGGEHKTLVFLGDESHIHFIIMELLKNSSRALIKKHGELDLDEAPPIQLQVAQKGARVGKLSWFLLPD